MRLRCVLLTGGILLAESSVPKVLLPPQSEALILHLNGKGKQIYTCQSAGGVYTWKLKAPDAKLFRPNGELAGRHCGTDVGSERWKPHNREGSRERPVA